MSAIPLAAYRAATNAIAYRRVECRGERHVWQHDAPTPTPSARCQCGQLTYGQAVEEERDLTMLDFGEGER